MKWNNASERKKFERKQAKLAEEYRAAGMTEEQIREMYAFDLAELNSDRRYCEHSMLFPANTLDESGDDKSPLLADNMDALSNELDHTLSTDRYWWIEEIDDPALAAELKKLPAESIEMLTLYAIEGFTHEEIAKRFGLTRRAITKRIDKLRKLLGTFRK